MDHKSIYTSNESERKRTSVDWHSTSRWLPVDLASMQQWTRNGNMGKNGAQGMLATVLKDPPLPTGQFGGGNMYH